MMVIVNRYAPLKASKILSQYWLSVGRKRTSQPANNTVKNKIRMAISIRRFTFSERRSGDCWWQRYTVPGCKSQRYRPNADLSWQNTHENLPGLKPRLFP